MTSVKRVVALKTVVDIRHIKNTNFYWLHWVGVEVEDNDPAVSAVGAKNISIAALRSETGVRTLPRVGRWPSVKGCAQIDRLRQRTEVNNEQAVFGLRGHVRVVAVDTRVAPDGFRTGQPKNFLRLRTVRDVDDRGAF